MDRHDRFGFRRDRSLNRLGVQIEGLDVNVGKDGPGTDKKNAVGRGNKGERCGNHLVTGTDSVGKKGNLECGCAGGGGDCVLDANKICKGLLKGGRPRTLNDVA